VADVKSSNRKIRQQETCTVKTMHREDMTRRRRASSADAWDDVEGRM
jgi:hypothetical protein